MKLETAIQQARTLARKQSAIIAVRVDNKGNFYPVSIADIDNSDNTVCAFDRNGKWVTV